MFAGVKQAYSFVALGLEVIHLALVERAGVDVEGDGARTKGRRVDDEMDGLLGVDLGRSACVDDVGVRGDEFAELRGGFMTNDAVVLHLHLAGGDAHPAAWLVWL